MPRLRPLCLLAALTGLGAASPAAAQRLTPVYDARQVATPGRPSQAVVQAMRARVLPEARRRWAGAASCDGADYRIVDVAQGAFTAPGRRQTAVLYTYCTTGHNGANNGVAILEGSRVVGHHMYAGGAESALGALPDLNANRRNELIVASGGTNQGITWSCARVYEAGAQSLARIAEFPGLGQNGLAYRTYATTGARPAFSRQGYRQQGGGWVAVGGRAAFAATGCAEN